MTCEPTDRLLQTLRVQTPGATDDMISLHLYNIMDEFFRRTSAWIYETDIELKVDLVEYGLGVPSGAIMVRAMGVSHNGVTLPPAATGSQLVQSSLGRIEGVLLPDGDSSFDYDVSDIVEAAPGSPFSWAIYRPDYITVTNPADEEARKYPLKAVLALSLSRDCLECDCGDWGVPEWMWDTYFADWLDGALSRLYAMPMKPWSTPQHAVYHGKRFRNAMAQRKQEALRGFSFNVQTWRFPRGWGRR
jgi:hypothetical protein